MELSSTHHQPLTLVTFSSSNNSPFLSLPLINYTEHISSSGRQLNLRYLHPLGLCARDRGGGGGGNQFSGLSHQLIEGVLAGEWEVSLGN